MDTPLAASEPTTPAEAAATSVENNTLPLVQTAPATPSAASTDPFAPAATAPPTSKVSVPKAKEKDEFYSSDSDEETSETASKPRRQFKVNGLLFANLNADTSHLKMANIHRCMNAQIR